VSKVSETAETLRDAETALSGAIMAQGIWRSCENTMKAIREYGDALLAHHKAVEAAQAAMMKEET
jgi:hypothetical protein